MKKILFIAFTFLFFFFPIKAFAQDPNFDITVNSKYEVKETGVTTITQNISIKNKTEYYFTPTYSVSAGFENIENIKAYGEDGSIPFTLDDSDKENKNIKLKFEKRYAGLGSTNNFTLVFETHDIAKKRGNVWEVSIPGLSDPTDFSTYNLEVIVPESFGEAKIIKPEKNTLRFSKDEIGKSGIYLIFGNRQYYKFSLSYNISNPNLFPVKTEVALPPATSYQKVLINNFSKKPDNVTIDDDGNWIAQYSLFPQQKLTVVVDGVVEVSSEPSKAILSKEDVEKYLKPHEFWEVNDTNIRVQASKFKNAKDVYDFVTDKLSYSFEKVTEGNNRLGAKKALENPQNSVCLEFTDLFITMARAAGIPARAVEGFAYTDNSSLRPLSLVEDVLHSWPEYYDFEKQTWVMIDPTWGNTTKGMDYFNTLDFEHIAFVKKGIDSKYPIPAGGYKFESNSKDVKVEFASEKDFTVIKNIKISDDLPNYVFPYFALEGKIYITNTGNNLITNTIAIVVDSTGKKQEHKIESLPPGGQKVINYKIPAQPFLTNNEKVLKIQVENFTFTKKIKVSFIPDLSLILLFGGIIGGSIIIAIITYYTGSIFIQRRNRENSLRGKSKRH